MENVSVKRPFAQVYETVIATSTTSPGSPVVYHPTMYMFFRTVEIAS